MICDAGNLDMENTGQVQRPPLIARMQRLMLILYMTLQKVDVCRLSALGC